MKSHIPNTITLGNLLCGCIALVHAFEGDLVRAAYFVGIALVLDFLDGFVARMLKVTSAIGKDLDSLADMVTFGVVPGVVMFKMINGVILGDANGSDLMNDVGGKASFFGSSIISYGAFIITIFSCIRLAKFNNDKRQSNTFIGLPTPASAMLICSLPLIAVFQPEFKQFNSIVSNVEFLLILSGLMSLLLVSEIPLFALKFKKFAWSENRLVYTFIAVSLSFMVILKFAAIPLIIFLYISVSIVNNIFSKKEV